MEDAIFHLDSLGLPHRMQNWKIGFIRLLMSMAKSEMRRTTFVASMLELLGDAVRREVNCALQLVQQHINPKVCSTYK